VQEVLAHLPRLAARFQLRSPNDPEGQLNRWLCRLSVNAALSILRRERRRRAREKVAAERVPGTTSSDREWNMTIAAALAEMSDRSRRPLVLRYFAGCDDIALAEELGCRPGAARMRLSRSLAQLRRKLSASAIIVSLGVLNDRLQGMERMASALNFQHGGTFLLPRSASFPCHYVTGGWSMLQKTGALAATLALIVTNAAIAVNAMHSQEIPAPAPVHEQADDPVAGEMHYADAVKSLDEFTEKLWAELAKKPGNLFFSPYSVHSALTMAMQGAAGQTKEQMLAVLWQSQGDAWAHIAMNHLQYALNPRGEGSQLLVANGLYGQKGYAWRDAFLSLSESRYGTKLEQLDFIGDREGSREFINRRVEQQTHDRIRHLLAPGVLTPDTRLALVNALYFKGAWQIPFKKELTGEGDFHTPAGIVRRPFMHADIQVRCVVEGLHKEDGTSLIILPFRGGAYECVVMREGPMVKREWLNGFSSQWLSDGIAGAKSEFITIELPRIKLDMSNALDLNGPLAALGMTDAFSEGVADFDAMSPQAREDRLHIDKVLHKTFLTVDEAGTEAAAGTALISQGLDIAPKPAAIVRFDRPFLFAIRHVVSGATVFVGRIEDPGSSD
jgi:serpin B